MFKALEDYLEEISHYLSGREEREEILNEIRSHILEKAEAESGGATDESVAKVIASYGLARKVAEKYAEGRPIIDPAYRRHLFRYTTLLFAIHTLLTAIVVAFHKDFAFFPLVFIPRLGVGEALIYLPTAFLADLGIVTLVLYFVTQRGKDVRLPWPKFALDLDEMKPSSSIFRQVGIAWAFVIMTALTSFAVTLYLKFHTIIAVNYHFHDWKPLLKPEPGAAVSRIIIAMFAAGALGLLVRFFTRSRWVDVASDAVSLVLISLLLRVPFVDPFAVHVPARFLPKIKFGWTFLLLFIALMTTIDLVKNLIIIGRSRLARKAA